MTPEQWAAISADFHKLLDKLPANVKLDSDSEGTELFVTEDRIRFNGAEPDDYETMILNRARGGFAFCKTQHRPYDIVVTALLIVAEKHAPGAYDIGSDGDAEDWKSALLWVSETLGDGYEIPPRVRNTGTND